jgi:hypothetical protein
MIFCLKVSGTPEPIDDPSVAGLRVGQHFELGSLAGDRHFKDRIQKPALFGAQFQFAAEPLGQIERQNPSWFVN